MFSGTGFREIIPDSPEKERENMRNQIKIGVTEQGDAGLDLSWAQRLCPINIIISKELTPSLALRLLQYQEYVIFHATCTGWGGSSMEPNVPPPVQMYHDVKALLMKEFPASHMVLRIDPIIPTEEGIERAESILKLFGDTEIRRVRFSFLDMYPHIRERFRAAGVDLPYQTFTAPEKMRVDALKMLHRYETRYELESCAEDTPYQVGCVSQKDFGILGIPFEQKPGGFQRPGCLCCSGKTELLHSKKQCSHGCLYCYWKGD
jgi:hypothetical protein